MQEFDLVIACETFLSIWDLIRCMLMQKPIAFSKLGSSVRLRFQNGLALSNGIRYLEVWPNSFPCYRPEGYALRHSLRTNFK